MCCRYVYEEMGMEALAAQLGLPSFPRIGSHYNLAPTNQVVIVRVASGRPGPEAEFARWGLAPTRADDAAARRAPVNARAESLAETRTFRDAFRRRRCLVPATGFYEWRKLGRRRQPHLFRLSDAAVFCFAGLWETWRDPAGGEPLETCVIITTAPNELMRPIHNRMPAILAPENYERWLDPLATDPRVLAPLLRPYPAENMTVTAVSSRVNNSRHDDPACLEPASGADAIGDTGELPLEL